MEAPISSEGGESKSASISVGTRQSPQSVKVWYGSNLGMPISREVDDWVTQFINSDLSDSGPIALPDEETTQPGKYSLLRLHTARRQADDPYVAPNVRSDDKVAFHDVCHVMVANESSLAALNARLDKEQAGITAVMEQFRPNVVVNGLPEWNEDRYVISQQSAFPTNSPPTLVPIMLCQNYFTYDYLHVSLISSQLGRPYWPFRRVTTCYPLPTLPCHSRPTFHCLLS